MLRQTTVSTARQRVGQVANGCHAHNNMTWAPCWAGNTHGPQHAQQLCQTEAGAAELADAMQQLLQAAADRARKQQQQAEALETARSEGRAEGRQATMQVAAVVSIWCPGRA